MAKPLDNETLKKARSIKVSVLKAHLPQDPEKRKGIDFRKKANLINELAKINPEKLRALAEYYSALKERHSYFYKPRKGEILPTLHDMIKKLSDLKKWDKQKDLVYEVKPIVYDAEKKEAYITVKCYSEVRTLYASEPDPNNLKSFKKEHRKGFSIFIILHENDKVFEIRTRSERKASQGADVLSYELLKNVDKVKRLQVSKDKQLSIDPKIRCKEALVSELNYQGADEIRIRGEDVETTLNALKLAGVDFENMGAKITLKRTECDGKPIAFSSDGRISFKKMDSIYDKVRGLLQ